MVSNMISNEDNSKSHKGFTKDKYNKHHPDELPVKQLVCRNSVLTDLYENKHIQAVMNVFVFILVGQFFYSAVADVLYKGRLDLGVNLIQRGFSNVHWIVVIWTCLFTSTVLVYFGFKFWAVVRIKLKNKSLLQKIWDVVWLIIVFGYYIAFLYCPAVAVSVCEIRPAAKFGFTCEILRMLMKAHAFIRSNVPAVLKQGCNTDRKGIVWPQFREFMYFLWASSLLYRKSYPRTTSVRWKFVFNHILQLIATMFFTSFIFEKYIIDMYKDYGKKSFIWQDTVLAIVGNTPAAMGLMFSLFYTIQHAWMNACAEVLTFGDRLFYQDWWTATTFKDFFRKWNVLVQDWLYTYIYKDFYEIIMPNNKTVAKYAIFIISALAHEYITAITFGFFLPVLFFMFFGLGDHLINVEFKNKIVGGVFVYYGMSLGMSILSACFAIEYFYRENCPEENPTFTSYLIPRFYTCIM